MRDEDIETKDGEKEEDLGLEEQHSGQGFAAGGQRMERSPQAEAGKAGNSREAGMRPD